MSFRSRPGSFWNDARDAALRSLWLADTHSASQIATAIGAASRNAVIGRAQRIGLPGKSGKGRGRTKGTSLGIHPRNQVIRIASKGKPFKFATAPNMVRAPDLKPAPLPMPHADDKARVSAKAIADHECHWPVGDTHNLAMRMDEPVFCGLQKMPGSAYCTGHHARAFVTVRPRPPAFSAMPPIPVEKEREAA